MRFYNIADSDFDIYTRKPAPADQAWMRRHFARMQVYSPYFDSRTSWYPNGWVYKDSYAIKPHWPEADAHPEWILRDAEGNRLFIPWGCAGGTCPQYAADVGNREFRTHWIAEAAEILARGYRGLWVDDVNLTWRVGDGAGRFVEPIDPRTGKPMRLNDWRRNFADFLVEIRAAFPDAEIAHNAIWFAGPFDDEQILRQIDAADYINLERGATDPGLQRGAGRFGFERFLAFIDLVHARGRGVVLMDYGTELHEREFGLAAYLLINRGHDLLSSDQLAWTRPDDFWPGYRLDIGAARGDRYAWRGLLRRDFDCGYVLLNQPGAMPQRLSLPASDQRMSGETARTLILGDARGAVLRHECGKPTTAR